MVRKNRDEYRYIRGRNNGKHTIPLGAGAGGRIGNALIMNPLKIDEYKKFTENIYQQNFLS